MEELAQVARETVRDELREQTRRQRRKAVLYAASGAAALYAGGALALALGLALAMGLPDWAAALITAAVLGVVAYLLRSAARPSGPHQVPVSGGAAEARAPLGPSGGPAAPGYPPMPSTAPGASGVTEGGVPGTSPRADAENAPRWPQAPGEDISTAGGARPDPEAPRRRG